ncbi:MAG: 30S ribosomal protein S13 [uncultured bacterium]|uniref:Small ribosomal subunit protein uS13 n=1 Tax=Candidatus Uhrbacteria bacterium GW2011_GWC1_41_20 TaxID=1618983 RepID=A0A0G0VF65_9BACT|nr:MAG: 30S ribosomal protein S13 [uncultured bacterium]KKR22332.1 MAG: SSU ribosomal protein S13P [Candidatus Uhrbacteria bacterium GW2011_GWE1_39_46]KKR63546.1 MAG: SSU ribosomal protein S13P [Candidatus Uhrbacteria bacterium GW2011_GWC2_40_450]KKR89716.1 MAG: SSU ribosomal protein S13P [Candidatus Uhrbacteria bacterium GW2011_GWE2_41_1153]KKR89740.1 MAG: SSU ribosomal protein S13P [Candidatus Uhrbacteria bacterium GW2011_GWD2_41_121]KKR95581.1 MAG: SSU ribosomal protein S13P [Candidatus Uhr
MARISGVNIPTEKRVVIALTYIYGIGNARAKKILQQAQVDESIRVKDLTDDQVNMIRTIIDKNFHVEGELRREVLQDVKRMKDINCYRGSRHAKRLPARGQRTKTNSRTVRGNKRLTAGSGRRILTKT